MVPLELTLEPSKKVHMTRVEAPLTFTGRQVGKLSHEISGRRTTWYTEWDEEAMQDTVALLRLQADRLEALPREGSPQDTTMQAVKQRIFRSWTALKGVFAK